MMGVKVREEKPAPKPIAKVSEKKKKQLAESKPDRDKMQKWFEARVKESKGKCQECGAKINKENFAFAIMTVAHVLPKRNNMFPSVATHKDNSLELCVENGCHGKYDTSWENATQMKIWPVAVAKFIKIYPSIAPEERKHLPDVLRQEVL